MASPVHLLTSLGLLAIVQASVGHQETFTNDKVPSSTNQELDDKISFAAWERDWADYKNDEFQIVTIKRHTSTQKRRLKTRTTLSRNDSRHIGEETEERTQHFYFTGFGRHFHLKTKKNRNVLAPNFSAYCNNPSGTIEMAEKVVSDTSCQHLVGRLHDSVQTPSIVALTQCAKEGMSGYIRTNAEDFFLEPVSNESSSKEYRLYRKVREKFKILQDPEWYSSNSSRNRRSVFLGAGRASKTVEILLTLDHSMLQRYGQPAATRLALTVFNMVSAIFADGSIGHPVHLVLVALLLLEHEQPGFPMSHNAQHLLHNFCQWQATLQGSGTTQSTSRHSNAEKMDRERHQTVAGSHWHDHAVLITATDFCAWKNEPCNTLGYAPIRGMCQHQRSCSITKDTGLSVAYTIAHEIGHNLGMTHDGDTSDCPLNSGTLMAPALQAINGYISWSECSQKDLQEFLSTDQSHCLDNHPSGKRQLLLPPILPGQVYDANAQCQLQFGPKSSVCPFNFIKSICQTLWCQHGGRKCESKFLPAAEGTPCGPAKWCRLGQCVLDNSPGPSPINGQWSAWSSWSTCSRTCGGGISRRSRSCNSPKTQYGGRYCQGNSTEYYLCNPQSCPGHSTDIREIQCASFNVQPFRGHYYKWMAYTKGISGNSRCKLYCKASGWDFVASLSEKVLDGAPCDGTDLVLVRTSPYGHYHKIKPRMNNDRCIEGRCHKMGCDGQLGSDAILDSCGVCGGNGSSCRGIARSYHGISRDHPQSQFPSYDSATIRANENEAREKTALCSGSAASCRHLPCSKLPQCTAHWVLGDWRPCVGCHRDKGVQKRKVGCYIRLNGTATQKVGRRRCEIGDGRRPMRKRTCSCYEYHWVTGPWQRCIVPQGGCGEGTKIRQVTCRKKHALSYVTQSLKDCITYINGKPVTPPPTTRLSCSIPCTGRWVALPWSQCSATCGQGWKARRVTCVATDRNDSALCPLQTRPKTLQQCSFTSCFTSIYSQFIPAFKNQGK